MRDFEPFRPTGSDPEAAFAKSSWDKTHGPAAQLRSSSTVKIDRTSKGIFIHAKPSRGGIGWKWADPPGYTADKGYSVGLVVIVSLDNPFAANSGNLSDNNSADPGIYVCVKDTEAKQISWATMTQQLPRMIDLPTDSNGKWKDTMYWIPLAYPTIACPY